MGNLRKVIASISLVAILSTFAVTNAAFAKSPFTDVGDKHWFTTEGWDVKAKDAGIFTKTTAMPDASVIRADMAMMVAAAAGLDMTNLEAFPSGVFTDVKSTDYWYKALQAGRQANVFSEKPKFDAVGVTNRAQAAKVIVQAFGLTPATPKTKTLSDVNLSYTGADAWMNNIYTAYCYGLVKGGTFNPGANVTRAEFAKMLVVAKDAPTLKAECTKGEDVVPPVEVTGGDAGVSLSAETPDAVVIPKNASAVAVLALDLEAGDTDVTFNGFTVHKKGVGSLASTFQAYLYDGNDRLTAGKSLNSSTNNIEFSNVGFKVPAGKTKTLTLKVDVGATTESGEVQFELVSEESVKSTADAVSGDFPIVSEKIGLSTTTVGTITIAKNGSTTAPKVGEVGATVAKFTLNASTEAAKVSELGLYVTGTISGDDVTNLKLYVAGVTDPIAEVDGVNSKDLAQFVLDTPYEIEKGGTKSFYVTADMSPGRNADTLALYIDENTDVVAIGATYGFGMSVTKTNYMSTTCTAASSTTCSFSTLEGGDITIVSSGPSAADIAVNAKDVVLQNFTITSVSPTTFKNFEVGLISSVEAATAGGLIKDSDDSANFTDIKIINTETGETLMGPVDSTSFKTASGGSTAIADATDAAQAYYLFTDEFSMAEGETLKLALTADVANNTSLANETLIASLQIGSTYPQVKDVNNKTLTNSTSLVPSATITGKTMTVKAPSLTLSLASTPSSKTYVKGSKAVKFAGYTFACGSASTCKVTDISLKGYIDDNGNSSAFVAGIGADHSTALSTYVGSIALKDAAGNDIAVAKGVNSTTGVVNFTNLSWNLKAGESVTAYAVGDISSNAYANSNAENIYFSIAATTDVTAEDTDGNNIATVTGTPNSGATTVVTTSAGGTLTASIDSATPKENILIAGAADQSLTKLKFTTTDESFIISKLSINNRQQGIADANLGDNDDNVTSVKISYTNSAGATETKTGTLTGGTAEFSGLDLPIAADSDATVTVSATLNTITGGADAGTFVDLNLALNNFEAVAQGSGETYKASKLDAGTATLSIGTISWTDGDAFNIDGAQDVSASVDLGGSITLTVDQAGASINTLPVGTLLCIEDGGTCGTDTDLYVVTAYTVGSTEDVITATLIDDAGDEAYADNADVSYALPGTGYLTSSNQMHVYETKPTIVMNPSSPSGSRSVATSDNAFVFDVTAGTSEKVQWRTGKALTTCAIGFDVGNDGDQTIAAASTAAAIDGASCLLTQVASSTADDSVSFDAGAASVIKNYARASFWIQSDVAPEFADIQFGTDASAGAGATGSVDNTGTLAASDCTFAGTATATTLTANTWHRCDVEIPSATTTEQYFHIITHEITELANTKKLYIDQVVLYNDKITLDMSGDDIGTYAEIRASASNGTAVAYLKDGSDTLATGYIYKNTSAGSEGGSASVTFVPVSGTDAAIEISKGTTRTFTVQLSTSALLDEDAGADDPLTFSMDLGTSAAGTVTAGDVWWNDTNYSNATVGSAPGTSYALTTPGIVKWLGQVANTTLNSNTVKY